MCLDVIGQVSFGYCYMATDSVKSFGITLKYSAQQLGFVLVVACASAKAPLVTTFYGVENHGGSRSNTFQLVSSRRSIIFNKQLKRMFVCQHAHLERAVWGHPFPFTPQLHFFKTRSGGKKNVNSIFAFFFFAFKLCRH